MMRNLFKAVVALLVFSQIVFAQKYTSIADFKNENGSPNTIEDWYAYTDAPDKGVSTISNALKSDSTYVVILKEGNNFVAKIESYTLGKGENPYEPYVALGLGATKNGKTYDLSKCTDGFSYRYKGSAHSFRTELSTVKDYGFHQKMNRASENWATATISPFQLDQPIWSEEIDFDAKKIIAFSWEMKGDYSAKTGSLAIDDFRCLGNMPLPKRPSP